MAEDKKYLEAYTSPVGEAVFPWLTKADTEHDASGVFHVDLSVPADAADGFIAKLEKVRSDFLATLSVAQQTALTLKPVFKMEMTRYAKDATDDEKLNFVPTETGNLLFRMKLKNNVTTGKGETFTQEPIIVSADTGEKVTDPVYGGSILRVRGQIVPYTNAASGIVGVTLRMKAVQVIELVTGGSGGSAFWTDGFNDEEAA